MHTIPISHTPQDNRPLAGQEVPGAAGAPAISGVRCPGVRCPGVRCPAVRCPAVRCPAVRCRAARNSRIRGSLPVCASGAEGADAAQDLIGA